MILCITTLSQTHNQCLSFLIPAPNLRLTYAQSTVNQPIVIGYPYQYRTNSLPMAYRYQSHGKVMEKPCQEAKPAEVYSIPPLVINSLHNPHLCQTPVTGIIDTTTNSASAAF